MRKLLDDLRTRAGLSQESLAIRLGVRKSWVWRVLKGERRIDVVEFFWYCRACGAKPPKTAFSLLQEFEKRAAK